MINLHAPSPRKSLWTPPKPGILHAPSYWNERGEGPVYDCSFLPGMFPGGVAPPMPYPPPYTGYTDESDYYAGWSMGRKLKPTYNDAFYHLTSGKVDTLYNQSTYYGSTGHFIQTTAGQRPSVVAAGPYGRPAAVFDNAAHTYMGNDFGFLSPITHESGYYCVSAIIDSCTAASDSVVPNTDGLVYDSSNWGGMGVSQSNNAGRGWFGVFCYDTDYRDAYGEFTLGKPHLFEWYMNAHNIYCYIDGVYQNDYEYGSIDSGGSHIYLGSGGVYGLTGKIFEVVTFYTRPSGAGYTALINNMCQWCGAVPGGALL